MAAVCSFIGHRDIYDTGMNARLQAAVDQIIAEHEAVEFLIYPRGAFSHAFLLAALRARTLHPQKVTITFVADPDTDRETSRQELSYFYMSDGVITPDIPPSKSAGPHVSHRRKLQWIIQNATHLIYYFYDMLYDSDRQAVKGREALEIIPVTTQETEAAIWEAASRMTEKEQLVFQKINEGCSQKEAGRALGIRGEQARQLLQSGCGTIRAELMRRCGGTPAVEPCRQGSPTCGLFALGKATYESLTCFKYIADFLISVYGVSNIYVEPSYAHSGFLFPLTEFHPSRQKPRLTALIGIRSLEKDAASLDAAAEILCPPCHAVEHVKHRASESILHDVGVAADIIRRTDFCICDLTVSPHGEKIRTCAAQTKNAVLLDIGGMTGGQRLCRYGTGQEMRKSGVIVRSRRSLRQ